MRLLVLAAAATLVFTGTAMANEPVRTHHHHHHADAAAAEGSASPDTLSAHDAHMKNLHDSGYNPSNDFTAAGNIKSN